MEAQTEIEVFKTNVHSPVEADAIIKKLLVQFPRAIINFDLEDCDRILRFEDEKMDVKVIMETIINLGFNCEILN